MRWPPRRWLVVLVAVVLLAGGVVAVVAAQRPAPLTRLTIAAGNEGGVYYAYGEGLATAAREAYPGVRANVLATAASVQNLRLVLAGTADVAFSLADSAALAVTGRGPFTRAEPLRALAWLYDNYTQLVVRANSPAHQVADLRGRTVSLGAEGSGTELIAGRVLLAAGVDPSTGIHPVRLGLRESVSALRDGRIDAFFFSGGLPTPAITRLTADTAIRLIDMAGLATVLRRTYGNFYAERSIPATTYGLGHEVVTIGVPNYLVVREDLPEDTAFAITRLLFASKRTLVAAHPEALYLDPRGAVDTYPLRLHRGAVRYYREAKP